MLNATTTLPAPPGMQEALSRAFGEGRRLNGSSGESYGILNFNRETRRVPELPPLVIKAQKNAPEFLGADETRRPVDPPPIVLMPIVRRCDLPDGVPAICPHCGQVGHDEAHFSECCAA